ncbi:UDP-2,4-diacetamido-2,4,6-trideoxy-beta-L-altropyranose hydrolase [Rhizobium sp. 16-449-1b]|uniref:UDP-2,4-diacetamido-2,4, 6-trideoxy-beta-L-altropyranose hydrolase n=1 Tax=Rhizobium sp. 16-449-1b TaxID=2819989 RepID=UPI001AD977EB|nr:UDP-2,4-diacetamido-2,4,6-trideoxy-beta-L-altropyranose hydrolase [Rhizobium sp. 16-449-1b]MBO9194830.1 UDP-2,4-diacetamido-2,4,6-trideoxy-beta-L-altropyranose hydrolase [Rhizobium sp. 16-449-1b]
MQVAFRADASAAIGAGHVMRCLTLADGLRQKGAVCTFVSRDMPPALAALVAEKGHEIRPIDDERESLVAAAEIRPDWLVVDHYGLDADFEREMRTAVRKIMVIDDVADRPHSCDVLLDQNLGRKAKDYKQLVSADCVLLIGPHYALLRPDFAQFREASLVRRRREPVRHVLISMGGFDNDNVTGAVLKALKACELPTGSSLSIVMGQDAPWIADVNVTASSLPWPARVLVGVRDMAQLMMQSDLAIGAAGSSTWERCCLGLPTVMIVLAENQKQIASSVSELCGLESLMTDFSETALGERIRHFLVQENYNRAVAAVSKLCDGAGVTSVIEIMNTEAFS